MMLKDFIRVSPREFLSTPRWFIDGVEKYLEKHMEDGKNPLDTMEVLVARAINRAFGGYK